LVILRGLLGSTSAARITEDPQSVEPAALGREIVDIKEDRASGGDLFAAGQHQPTFMGQLPLQQRGHRTVARSAAEQLGVPAFGRGEIGGKQQGVGLLEVHGSSPGSRCSHHPFSVTLME
jgi:hypothetical protein